MKKILFITLLLLGVHANAQKVKAEVIELDTLTTTERNAMTVQAGKVQIVYDETIGDFYVNVKNGGWVTLSSLVGGGISNLVEDTTPQLGGTLDTQGFSLINADDYLAVSQNPRLSLRDSDNPDNRGFEISVNNNTDDLIFLSRDDTTTYGSYTLAGTGTPSAGTDLITKTYADANYGGGGSSLPVDDTTSLVQDPVDGTKEMRIDVGAVSTATVRTLTMPDADVDLGQVVVGPASATNSAIALFDGTTGKLLKNSTVSINSGSISSVQSISFSGTNANIFLTPTDTEPSAAEGKIYSDNSENRPKYHDGTSWKAFLLTGDATDDQTASEVTSTATGNVSATNVDAAIAELDSEKVGNTISSRTGTAVSAIMIQTEAQYAADGAPASNELVFCSDCSPASVVSTATIDMDGWKMYDDQTADAATITLSDCDPGETLTVYINRASAPTLAGTGLTFNQLPNTTAFASATEMMIIFEVAYDGTTIDYYYVER